MADEGLMDRIAAAMKTGDLREAEQLCERHLAACPTDTDAWQVLGIVLQQQDRSGDAVRPFRRLVELHPDDASHWSNLATALNIAGDPVGAIAAAETAVRLAPDDAGQLERLGMLQGQTGEWPDARDSLLHAVALEPGRAALRIRAAQACIRCGDTRAETMLAPWRSWLPLDDQLQYELCDALAQTGELQGAIPELTALLQRSPSHVPAQLLLAKGFERTNRLAEARALLQRVVTASGADVRREIRRQCAQLDMRDRHYEAARAQLEGLGPDDGADYGHYYALAQACDRMGDEETAMSALQTAHARQLEEARRCAPQLFEAGAASLPFARDRVSPAAYAAWPELKCPDTSQSPIFVVGFPRSGTTLLEQMLDAHPALQSMDERPLFTMLLQRLEDLSIEIPRDLGSLTQRDCDELRKGYLLTACSKTKRNWKATLVDKNPLNMLVLPVIYRLFPHARFILVLRHPCDAILSCYMQNFRSWPLAVASGSLDSLARAYVEAMQNWIHHAGLFKPRLLVSAYEDLARDPRAHAARIADFLGLDHPERLLGFAARAKEKGFIATPSYTEVVEPISQRSVGRWKRYRKWFQPVLPTLQPMLSYWNYDGDAP